jgi:hypothetical protein
MRERGFSILTKIYIIEKNLVTTSVIMSTKDERVEEAPSNVYL